MENFMDPDRQNDADPLDPDPQHWVGEKDRKKLKNSTHLSRAVKCGSAFIFCGPGSSCFSQCRFVSSCFFNSDPDPALTIFKKKSLMKNFLELKKSRKIA